MKNLKITVICKVPYVKSERTEKYELVYKYLISLNSLKKQLCYNLCQKHDFAQNGGSAILKYINEFLLFFLNDQNITDHIILKIFTSTIYTYK